MKWSSFIMFFMNFFRKRRMNDFVSAYPDLGELCVLDVGGRPYIWDLLRDEYGIKPRKLVLLNTEDEAQECQQGDFDVKVGDGRAMEFSDDFFDLVFSNSVIEHVGSIEDMREFASECVRVAKEVYIQTPCKYFFVEPHLVTLFIHFLPRALYRKLSFLSLRYISLHSNKVQFYKIFDGINLLTERDFCSMFPNQKISFERFISLKKSMIASDRSI